MRTWNLGPGDPLCLTLAADWRLSAIDYTNDPIWELNLGQSEPAAVLLHSTFGLRARDLRLFPRFTEGQKSVSDPAAFDAPPRLLAFAPNRLHLAFAPFPGLDVEIEYWLPQGGLVAGRVQVANRGVTRRKLKLDWVALLNPSGEAGEPMLPLRRTAVQVLQGRTADLYPVLFFTGGPQASRSPYPALSHELDLLPGGQRRFTWVLATHTDPEESFRLARHVAARNWDAEMARIEMVNAAALNITTGNPDWDAAFALGQSQAHSLLLSPTTHLPYAAPVSARRPDHGFSPAGDGSDYGHLWNGYSPLDAWSLAQNLLPGHPEAAQGLVRNFIATRTEDGRLDHRPGLGGQRARLLAAPLLADLAWRIYQHTRERAFLEETLAPLLDHLQAWFSETQDRDGDGIPEWERLDQTGFEDNPTFARWPVWGQGADIRLVESPDLCALLYNECQAILRMAAELGRAEPVASVQALAENLRTAVEASWDARASTYRYWDRDHHQSPKGETLGQRKGDGQILIDQVFDWPQRVLLRLETPDQSSPPAEVFVHGVLPNGQHRVQRLGRALLGWLPGRATATLETLFAELEHIQVEGLPPRGQLKVSLLDYRREDHTLLLPLWAGIPDARRARALIDRKVSKPAQYGWPFGLPASPNSPKGAGNESLHSVWLPWNMMVAEGLLRYGQRSAAVELVSKLMEAIVANLKREGAFRKLYHAETGQGLGDRNALLGLPPLGLFMQTLGVRILSPWQVVVEHFNPFPWPVKIQYRGLTVECLPEETLILFPDGQSVSLDTPGPHFVRASFPE